MFIISAMFLKTFLLIIEDRVKAARAVIGKVRSSKRNIITSLEKLSEAYIELAYYDVSQYKAHTGSKIKNVLINPYEENLLF